MDLKFVKMHGNGNDFIVIEDFNRNLQDKESDIAIKLCHRNFGIGGDGILLVRNTEEADIEMAIINSDGSLASMCGNGIRCFAKYVYDKGIVKNTDMSIKTGDGIKVVNISLEGDEVKEIKVNMGLPDFEPSNIPSKFKEKVLNKNINVNNRDYYITAMHMGVPHTVVFGKLEDYNIEEGKYIEKYPLFTAGTNVNFCEVLDKNNIRVKTWERGAGPTLACGTGNCASTVAANLLGFTGKTVNVHVQGGSLRVDLCDDGVYMIGNAVNVFEGNIL